MANSTLEPRTVTIDSDAFREVAGRFASGLTVITAMTPEGPCGTTVSAVSSLSLEPPMMLVCLNRSSSIHDDLLRVGRFAINILAADQGFLARQFARRGSDKFADVSYSMSGEGVPVLDGALANIVCDIESTTVGGTHSVLLGLVRTAVTRDCEPLVYYRSGFGAFSPSV